MTQADDPNQLTTPLGFADTGTTTPSSGERDQIAEGTVVDGFTIVSLLGRGGMGEVYKARDATLQRLVALKIVGKAFANNEEFVKRFEREARAASSLSHPNVAQVFSTGRFAGRPYFAMEFVEGSSLAEILKKEGPISGLRCLRYLEQAAEALRAALAKGIVHRDIKPDNLMLEPSGKVKLVDFGLARSMADESRLTQANIVMGTPDYMSPEQIRGQQVDHRSDIYSLGASFYQLFSGRAPFGSDSAVTTMMKHVSEPLPPLKSVNARVPQSICVIVEKMMAKTPEARYQTYDALIRDLQLTGSGKAENSLATRTAASASSRSRRDDQRLLIGGAVAVAIVLIFFLSRRGSRTSPQPTPASVAVAPAPSAPVNASQAPTVIIDADGTPQRQSATPGEQGIARPTGFLEQPSQTSQPQSSEPTMPQYLTAPQAAYAISLQQRARTAMAMSRMATAVQAFMAEKDHPPSSLVELRDAYGLTPGDETDGWSRAMRFEQTGARGFRISSAGPDGSFGTSDDIVNENGMLMGSH